MHTENHQLDVTNKSSGSSWCNVMCTHLYKNILHVYLGNQTPGTMKVAQAYFYGWKLTYDFKDGVQQVCLIIAMFYTLIMCTLFTCMLFINGNSFISLILYTKI